MNRVIKTLTSAALLCSKRLVLFTVVLTVVFSFLELSRLEAAVLNNRILTINKDGLYELTHSYFVTNVAQLTNAIKNVPSGYTIFVEDGLYDLSGPTCNPALGTNALAFLQNKTNVTLQALGKNAVLFTTNVSCILQMMNCRGIKTEGLIFQSIKQGPLSVLTSGGFWAMFQWGQTNIDLEIIDCTFRTNQDHAIAHFCGSPEYSSNVVIRNCKFYDIGGTNWTDGWQDGAAVQITGPDWTIDGCMIDGPNRTVEIYDTGTDNFANYGKIKITNNKMLHIKRHGLLMQNVAPIDYLLFQDNILTHLGDHAGTSRSMFEFGGAGVSNIVIRKCTFQGAGNKFTDTYVIQAIYGVTGVSYYFNSIEIVGNTFENLAAAIILANAGNVKILGNSIRTIYNVAIDINGVNYDIGNNNLIDCAWINGNSPYIRVLGPALNAAAYSGVTNIFIHDNLCSEFITPGNAAIGIQTYDQRVEMANNIIRGMTVGIQFQLGASNCIARDNHFLEIASHPLQDLNPIGHNLLEHNYYTNAFYSGTNDSLASRYGFVNPFKGTNTGVFDVAGGINSYGSLYVRGGASQMARTGGTMFTNLVQIGNGAGTLTTLFTNSIPINTITNLCDTLRVTASGDYAASANIDKTIVLWIGNSIVFSNRQAINSGSFTLDAEIIRATTTTNYQCSVSFHTSTAAIQASWETNVSAFVTNSLTPMGIWMTGNGTGASDIVGKSWRVEWKPTP